MGRKDPVHRESADDGPGLPHSGLTHAGIRRSDPDLAPHGGTSTGPRSEEDRGRVRAAGTRHGGTSAQYRATLRRADALIADTRALLARLEAEAFRPDPAAPPRLRLVGGTEWSGEPGGGEGRAYAT